MDPEIVISCDSHTDLYLDLKPWLPAKYHPPFEQAIQEDEARFYQMLAFSGRSTRPQNVSQRESRVSEYRINTLTPQDRLAKLDADGVAAEFILESGGARSDDPEFFHQCNLAYGRWFEEYTSVAPHRFNGSTCVVLTDIEMAVSEVYDAHAHGLGAVHISGQHQYAGRDLPPYNDRYYAPLWEAMNELEMALVFHPRVGREKPLLAWRGTEPGWETVTFRDVKAGHQEALPFLLVAGIPQRYPKIRFGYVESGSQWIPPILEQLDDLIKRQPDGLSIKLDLLPSEQFQRQAFAAGPLTAAEVAQRHTLGVSNLMWGSDFPHPEGTYPRSREHLGTLLNDLPEEERQAILSGNAARFLGFDLVKLADSSAALTGSTK